MRVMNQSTVAMFLVAVFSLAMWPASDAVAQDDNPFGSDAPVNKAAVKPAKAVIPKAAPPRKPSVVTKTYEIRNRLNRNFDLVYDSEPFGDVVAQLREELGINIVIDSNLDGVLDGDTEVSANLSGISLADGLRTLLKAVDATYTIRDGVLLIISIDDEGEPDYLTRHMIDVHELLSMIKVTESDRIGKPVVVSVSDGRFSGGNKSGGGTFQVAAKAEANAAAVEPKKGPEQQVELLTAPKVLTDVVSNVVASDFWEVNGGGNGGLICVGDVLIVISSEKVAGDVRSFIDDLKFKMKNQKK